MQTKKMLVEAAKIGLWVRHDPTDTHREDTEWEGISQSSLTLWPLTCRGREVKRLPQFVSEETDIRIG